MLLQVIEIRIEHTHNAKVSIIFSSFVSLTDNKEPLKTPWDEPRLVTIPEAMSLVPSQENY